MNTYTGLASIHLQNYRCFADLTVELDKYLTVLVADNGLGKTTVLDAIAILLSAFVSPFQSEYRKSISQNDVLLKVMDSNVLEMEPQYPVNLETESHIVGTHVSWGEEKVKQEKDEQGNNKLHISLAHLPAKSKSDQMRKELADLKTNASVILPVIAYYGTGRLWNHLAIEQTVDKKFDTRFFSRTAGYQDCLNPASSYESFVEWFRYATKAHNELRDQNIEQYGERALKMETPYLALLNGINQAVEICLQDTGWHNLRYSSIHQEPVVEHKTNGILPVSQLSDGIRNMIAMVADIAYRAVRLNKQFKADAPQKSPGIILIDEVDMHLHPKWQQRVLTQLRKAFPAMQFIVTTHSPQVLSTIASKHIRRLTENNDGESIAAIPMAESYARTNADVLQAVMCVDPMPKVPESHKLKQYRSLIEQGDLQAQATEINQLREELEKTLGEDHPVLLELDTTKQWRELS